MGSRLAELDQRDLARVRAELIELIAARFAYPPFFDYRAGAPRMRPVSATRRQQIAQFVQAVDLGAIEQVDLDAAPVRRFLERLLQRYLDSNPDLAREPARQRVSLLRVSVPRVAAEAQRGLIAFVAGDRGSYGLPRARASWLGAEPTHGALDPARMERSAQYIQAALLPRRDSPATANGSNGASESTLPAATPAASILEPPAAARRAGVPPVAAPLADLPLAQFQQTEPQPAVNANGFHSAASAPEAPNGNGYGNGNGHAADVSVAAWASMLRELSGPMPTLPTHRDPPVPTSPFAGLEAGIQSGLFGPLPENPFTEPMVVPPSPGNGHAGNGYRAQSGQGNASHSVDGADGPARELPPGMIEMYSEYLRALRPTPAPPGEAPPGERPNAWPNAWPVTPPTADDGAWERSTMPPAPGYGAYGASPAHVPTPPPMPLPVPDAAGGGNDQMIFAQLRNQLDAYLRMAAREVGLPATASDPAQVLDGLRRAGRMSAGDVRLAERILTITGRVLAGESATPEDYRQAFMLYLLYHRSRVGE